VRGAVRGQQLGAGTACLLWPKSLAVDAEHRPRAEGASCGHQPPATPNLHPPLKQREGGRGQRLLARAQTPLHSILQRSTAALLPGKRSAESHLPARGSFRQPPPGRRTGPPGCQAAKIEASCELRQWVMRAPPQPPGDPNEGLPARECSASGQLWGQLSLCCLAGPACQPKARSLLLLDTSVGSACVRAQQASRENCTRKSTREPQQRSALHQNKPSACPQCSCTSARRWDSPLGQARTAGCQRHACSCTAKQNRSIKPGRTSLWHRAPGDNQNNSTAAGSLLAQAKKRGCAGVLGIPWKRIRAGGESSTTTG
jgi:hypothetical protein